MPTTSHAPKNKHTTLNNNTATARSAPTTKTTTVLPRFETGSIGKSCFRYALISLALLAALIFRPKLAQNRFTHTITETLNTAQINVNPINRHSI